MTQTFDEDPKSLQEYWEILKRRRYLFGVPAMAIMLLAVFYALDQPDIYRSEAIILIEDQDIPKDIVGATITSYASQQIQSISQRILTISNIQAVVDKFEVYGSTDSARRVPASVLAEWFREDMGLGLVNAEEFGSGRGKDNVAIAFTLAFYSADPLIAQQVTQELVSLFLNENRRASASVATGVSALLSSAIEDANEELLVAEANLAEFKAANEGALPELHQLNFDVINRMEQQLSDVNLRIQELEQRTLQLSTQLASISPSAPVTLPSGETIMGDRSRLSALLIDYRRKIAIYEPGHPDLVRLKREIEMLRGSVDDEETTALIESQLRQERDRLSGLRDRYSEDHPDIKNAEAAVSELESQLAAANLNEQAPIGAADNPTYVLIDTQLQSAKLEIQSLENKRSELQKGIAKHEALIRRGPQVEMQYGVLMRSYENARTKYRDLQAKLRVAEVAANVEQELTGQRFTLIEPPALPIFPESQNRSGILMMGLILAIGVGAGIVVIVESMDNTVRSAKELMTIAGPPPLAVIPYLNNSVDVALSRRRRLFLVAALLASGAISVTYVIYLM